ncbi:hypothetical protein CEQ90_12635 [Lewinellaceae bacterium SD302]|nr:hypothetical protein CEQ90_12635 [Lewinellaceae bacterium SD302]
MPMHRIYLIICSLLIISSTFAQDMSNVRLDSLLKEYIPSAQLEGTLGSWQISLEETIMLCITDEAHDRMRIISPVIEASSATPEQILACMEANFHTALDVKYAIADDVIWVAFIHPLRALRDEQFLDAIAQVRSAAQTFGSTYASTDLVFPKSKNDEDQRKADEKKARIKKL